MFTKEWMMAALNRAVRTMAQVALTMFTVGQALTEVDWKLVVSCSITAGIYSILTSIVLGTPESKDLGTVNLDNFEGDDVLFLSDLKVDPLKLKDGETVVFKVKKTEKIAN